MGDVIVLILSRVRQKWSGSGKSKKRVSDEEEKCVRTVKRRKTWRSGYMDGLYINPLTFTLQCCNLLRYKFGVIACKLE